MDLQQLLEKQVLLGDELKLLEHKISNAESNEEKRELKKNADQIILDLNKVSEQIKVVGQQENKKTEEAFKRSMEVQDSNFNTSNTSDDVFNQMESGKYDYAQNKGAVPQMEYHSFNEQLYGINYKRVNLLGQSYYEKAHGAGDYYVEMRPLTIVDEEYIAMNSSNTLGDQMTEIIKSTCKFPTVKYNDLILADKFHLFLAARIMMDNIYTIPLTDPKTGTEFNYDFDLTKLEIREAKYDINANGLFELELPRSKVRVSFKPLTIGRYDEIQKAVREARQLGTNNMNLDAKVELSEKIKQLAACLHSWNGEQLDALEKFKRIVPLARKDYIAYMKALDNVTPTYNLNISVEAPSGHRFSVSLPILKSFILPS